MEVADIKEKLTILEVLQHYGLKPEQKQNTELPLPSGQETEHAGLSGPCCKRYKKGHFTRIH